MRQPIKEVWRERAQQFRIGRRWRQGKERIVGKRERGDAVLSVDLLAYIPIQRVFRQPGSPGFIEPLLECAALVGPAIVIVTGGDHGADSGQVRRMGNCREHLGRADIGAAIHSYSAVRIGKRGRPFDGVVTVVGFVKEWIPFTIGRVAAAHILIDDYVAPGGPLQTKGQVVILVVWSTGEKNGEFTRRIWAIDVGTKNRAIAHLHSNAALDDGRGLIRSERKARDSRNEDQHNVWR